MSDINDFIYQMTGIDRDGSIKNKICPFCNKPVGEFRDELSRKENSISGLCQNCQDGVFGSDVSDSVFEKIGLPTEYEDSIDDIPYLLEILGFDGVYLAGGLLRTITSSTEELSPEKTDIDLFFKDEGSLNRVKSWLEITEYKKVYQCPEGKLATYVFLDDEDCEKWKIQLISVDFYPDTESLIDSFDFTCTMFGTDGKEFVFHKDAIRDTEEKHLVFHKITYPSSTLRRMMKYSRKGYWMMEEDYQTFVEAVYTHSPDIKDEKLVYVD
jgi:hypothetical protein